MSLIIVIEPQPLFRIGLLKLLSTSHPALTLEGYDYDHLSTTTGARRNCDLVLLSIKPCEKSTEQISAINKSYTPKSILLLSEAQEVPASLYKASSLISGVVYKNTTPEILVASTALVLAGGTCFPVQHQGSSPEAQPLLSQYQPEKWPLEPDTKKITPAVPHEASMLGLTSRQYEVLVLLARGHSLKIIGTRLNISVATAKAHTETLYQRLDVHNRNEAVYTAVARGATLGWSSTPAIQTRSAYNDIPNS